MENLYFCVSGWAALFVAVSVLMLLLAFVYIGREWLEEIHEKNRLERLQTYYKCELNRISAERNHLEMKYNILKNGQAYENDCY